MQILPVIAKWSILTYYTSRFEFEWILCKIMENLVRDVFLVFSPFLWLYIIKINIIYLCLYQVSAPSNKNTLNKMFKKIFQNPFRTFFVPEYPFVWTSHDFLHLLLFIRDVYKERFLVLVKSIEIVRNRLVKSSKTIKLLRNGTSQKTFRKENFRVFPVFPPNFPEISWIVPNFFLIFQNFSEFSPNVSESLANVLHTYIASASI